MVGDIAGSSENFANWEFSPLLATRSKLFSHATATILDRSADELMNPGPTAVGVCDQ
jgi:hypothetical protein